MIYLIDDTPVQMLGGYLNLAEYADVIKRLDSFSSEDIFSLFGASCVLMHSSFHDPKAKKQVLSFLRYGEESPIVLFSDGDSPEAEFHSETYIISIKKSVLYSRLPRFIDSFRKTGVVNLRLLSCEDAEASKPVAPSGSRNAFELFFSQHNLDFASNEKRKTTGPRIYCVGRDGMDKLARSIDGKYVRATVAALKESNDRKQDEKIHDFLSEAFTEEVRALLLDVDADPLLFMRIALHFRLSETLPGKSRLAPVVLVSDLKLNKLVKKGMESQILMTDGVHISSRSSVGDDLKSFKGLDEGSFRDGFLNKITIPAPQGSNHSLANQWGASRLYMIIKGQGTEKDAFKGFQNIHKDLYFKYVFHKIPPSAAPTKVPDEGFRVSGSAGKHILLIDDEADKGWTKTMSLLFPIARFNIKEDVISESVLDYGSLSEGARKKIESRDYDLVLLDLRLGGVREDYVVVPEDMSGYKVLRRIKECNRGTQVIMLTASNKAWNLKALMQPGFGADGYFVKESPEYGFSDELSVENLRSLIADAERCLRQGYLRGFWDYVRSFDGCGDELVKEVHAQLMIAYDMAARAGKPEEFGYAFLALYQVVEIVTSALTDWEVNTDPDRPNTKLLVLKGKDGRDRAREIVHPKDAEVITRLKPIALQTVSKNAIFHQKDKVAALYLQLWKKQEHGMLFLIGQIVAIRNSIIHPDNGKDFDLASPMREASVSQSGFFNDGSLAFGMPELKSLFREAASCGLLYADTGGRPTLHRDISQLPLGIRFLLACLKDFLSPIQP